MSADETIWSPEIAELIGRPGAEPSRRLIIESLHPDDLDRIERIVQSARVSGDVFDAEYRVFGTMQDITELRGAEFALRARNDELALAVRASDVIVWTFDPRTGRAAYSSVPDSPPETLDDVRSFAHPDDAPRLISAIETPENWCMLLHHLRIFITLIPYTTDKERR